MPPPSNSKGSAIGMLFGFIAGVLAFEHPLAAIVFIAAGAAGYACFRLYRWRASADTIRPSAYERAILLRSAGAAFVITLLAAAYWVGLDSMHESDAREAVRKVDDARKKLEDAGQPSDEFTIGLLGLSSEFRREPSADERTLLDAVSRLRESTAYKDLFIWGLAAGAAATCAATFVIARSRGTRAATAAT